MRSAELGLRMHEVLLGDGHISPEDYVLTLARILDVPFIDDPISAGYRYRKRGVPSSTEAVWRTGWEGPSVAVDGSAFSASELVRRHHVMRRQGLELALTTPGGLRSCQLESVGGRLMAMAIHALGRRSPAASARFGAWLWQQLVAVSLLGLIFGALLACRLSVCYAVP
jgi:hypothetical protein